MMKIDKESYNKAIKDVLKVLSERIGGSCLCGHFDPCSGACKSEVSDYIPRIKKLVK